MNYYKLELKEIEFEKKRSKLDHRFLWWVYWKKNLTKISQHRKALDDEFYNDVDKDLLLEY